MPLKSFNGDPAQAKSRQRKPQSYVNFLQMWISIVPHAKLLRRWLSLVMWVFCLYLTLCVLCVHFADILIPTRIAVE